MLKIVKTPTIKQFSYYFFTITKWKKKNMSFVFFFPFFFGDVIIHKTGTMLATGQGPIATPLGSESVTDGNGVRDPGVTAGAEGPGRAGGRGGTTANSVSK